MSKTVPRVGDVNEWKECWAAVKCGKKRRSTLVDAIREGFAAVLQGTPLGTKEVQWVHPQKWAPRQKPWILSLDGWVIKRAKTQKQDGAQFWLIARSGSTRSLVSWAVRSAGPDPPGQPHAPATVTRGAAMKLGIMPPWGLEKRKMSELPRGKIKNNMAPNISV